MNRAAASSSQSTSQHPGTCARYYGTEHVVRLLHSLLSESVGMCRPSDLPFSPQEHPLVGYSNVKNTPVGYHFFVLSHSLWVIFVKFSYLATLLGSFLWKFDTPVGVKLHPHAGGWGENSPRGPLTPTRFGAKCITGKSKKEFGDTYNSSALWVSTNAFSAMWDWETTNSTLHSLNGRLCKETVKQSNAMSIMDDGCFQRSRFVTHTWS